MKTFEIQIKKRGTDRWYTVSCHKSMFGAFIALKIRLLFISTTSSTDIRIFNNWEEIVWYQVNYNSNCAYSG